MLRFTKSYIIFLVCVSTAICTAQDDWLPTVEVGTTSVRVETLATGFSTNVGGVPQILPTKLVPIPDGSERMVVATLGGLLRVIDTDGNISTAGGGVYLNTNTSETEIQPFVYGLTSIAFHPDFAVSGSAGLGKFYVLVTESPKPISQYDFVPAFGNDNNHAAVLVEYTVAADAINSNALIIGGGNQNVTRRELLVVQEPDNEHNFCDLAFDTNGYLYISVGDGAFNFNGGINTEALNAPNLSTVLGKVLRIDPVGNNSANGNYGIVSSNPFVGDGDPDTLGEIFSIGHRNPWRISIDNANDRIVVGEVGHFNIEEINVVTAGGNYGWPSLEGSFLIDFEFGFALTPDIDDAFANANSLTPPVFEYDHQDGVSVTGGFVYRGSQIPELAGKYIFAEFQGSNFAGPRLFAGDLETGEFEQLVIADGPQSLCQPVSLGENSNGELYVVTIDGSVLEINSSVLAGDVNRDSAVDLLDVQGFVEILNNGGFQAEADVNRDGVVNLLDVAPFIDLLIG